MSTLRSLTRWLACLLVFSVIFGLCACRNEETDATVFQPGIEQSEVTEVSNESAALPGYYYANEVEITSSDGSPCYIKDISSLNGEILVAYGVSGSETQNQKVLLAVYESTGTQKCVFDITNSLTEDSPKLSFCTNGTKTVLIANALEGLAVYEIDTQGQSINQLGTIVELTSASFSDFYQMSPDGTLFLSSYDIAGGGVYEYTFSGKQIGNVSESTLTGGVLFLDGETYAFASPGVNQMEQLIALNTDTWELGAKTTCDEIRYPESLLYANQGVQYLASDGIWSYDATTMSSSIVVDWTQTNLSNAKHSFFDKYAWVAAGCYVTVPTIKVGYSDSFCILTYSETSPNEVKEELILAGFYLSSTVVEQMVLEFNETNDKYYITLVDYNSYRNESGEYYRGDLKDELYRQVMLDIKNGEGPDMLWFENGWDSTLPCQQFEEAGLLLDLMPYFEKDESFSLDELLPNVVDACTINGQLCKLPVGSYIMSYFSHPLLDEDGLSSLEEFEGVMSSMPNDSVAVDYMTQSELLQNLLIFDGEQFTNRDTNTTSFDSDAFIDMLEFSALYGLDDGTLVYNSAEMLSSGKVALSSIITTSPWSLDVFDAEKTITGLPGVSQSAGYIFPVNMIAATSSSKHPDGAYEFIKLMMSEEAQSIILGYNHLFPTRLSVYEYMVGITDYPENFHEISLAYLLDDGADGDGESVVPTQEQIAAINEQFIELCDHTTLLFYPDADITNIIMEEAPYYFSGQKIAEDVAALIQTRTDMVMSTRN